MATSGRLCGGLSISANFPGDRPNGQPQDAEMDVAWQELMAITELQVTMIDRLGDLCFDKM